MVSPSRKDILGFVHILNESVRRILAGKEIKVVEERRSLVGIHQRIVELGVLGISIVVPVADSDNSADHHGHDQGHNNEGPHSPFRYAGPPTWTGRRQARRGIITCLSDGNRPSIFRRRRIGRCRVLRIQFENGRRIHTVEWRNRSAGRFSRLEDANVSWKCMDEDVEKNRTLIFVSPLGNQTVSLGCSVQPSG